MSPRQRQPALGEMKGQVSAKRFLMNSWKNEIPKQSYMAQTCAHATPQGYHTWTGHLGWKLSSLRVSSGAHRRGGPGAGRWGGSGGRLRAGVRVEALAQAECVCTEGELAGEARADLLPAGLLTEKGTQSGVGRGGVQGLGLRSLSLRDGCGQAAASAHLRLSWCGCHPTRGHTPG